MKTLKALIFDVDGTLSDTERDGHRVAFNRAFAEAGLNWHWSIERYGQLLEVTGGKERIHSFINDCPSIAGLPKDTDAFVRDLHQLKTRHFIALLESGAIGLRPGVKRLLSEARAAGLRLGIATTTTRQNVTTLLSATLGPGSIAWFDVIAAGDVVPNKKPAPDIYRFAMDQMGLTAAQCLAFEDSENGFQSSIQAGLKTLVTVNAYTRTHPFKGAAIVLDQLGEPDSPFHVLAGDAGHSTRVDLPLLHRIFVA